MSKVTEITVAIKRGLPNYSSIMSSATYQVGDDDNLKDVWDEAKKEVLSACNTDASWVGGGDK